jgi:hypothetical protein
MAAEQGLGLVVYSNPEIYGAEPSYRQRPKTGFSLVLHFVANKGSRAQESVRLRPIFATEFALFSGLSFDRTV